MKNNNDIVVNTRIGITVPLLSKIALNAEVKLEYDSGASADVEALDQTFKFGGVLLVGPIIPSKWQEP